MAANPSPKLRNTSKIISDFMPRDTYNIKYTVDANGCHVCTSHKPNDKGMPYFQINNVTYSIVRWMYEKYNNKIPAGLVVRHKCDNRMCINIEHLELGTKADNNRDRKLRGRNADTHGEKCHTAKLTNAQALAIFLSGKSRNEIAKEFKVRRNVVDQIKTGRRWSKITGLVHADYIETNL